jgi:hypothetical protein
MSDQSKKTLEDRINNFLLKAALVLIFSVLLPIVGGFQMGYGRANTDARLFYGLGFVVCAVVVWLVMHGDLETWVIALLPLYMAVPYLIGTLLRSLSKEDV